MKNKLILSPLALLLISGLFILLFSCRRDEDSDLDNSVSSEIGIFENIVTDADNMLGQVWQGDGTVGQRLSSAPSGVNALLCANVLLDTVAQNVIIDFGNGCVGLDGRTRAGRIQITYTGPYFTSGSVHTMTFDSFYVDTRHIEGTRIITNTGFNSSNYMTWSVQAINMRMTLTNGYWRSWNSNRTREMTQGFGDNDWQNDAYRINGTGNGTNSNSQNFSAVITNILRTNSCRWIVSGTISITPAGRATRTIDFGSGACDDQAIVSIGNNSRTITLR
ncbi:MAG: hypothetical protein RL021_27 [Bacteroidota bacterium]|jgi:hypothetical protein